MLFLLIALRTKEARPAESFIGLVTRMLVVNYPCSSSSRTDVLLEKMRVLLVSPTNLNGGDTVYLVGCLFRVEYIY